MGSGAFPIVTDIPANREWITDDQNGFLVPVEEEKYLASKIVDAIRNQAFRQKSRTKNLCIVQEKAFWPAIIGKVKEIYSGLLN
jgi:glycosyltransferase involved in cell wall biosynthesis